MKQARQTLPRVEGSNGGACCKAPESEPDNSCPALLSGVRCTTGVESDGSSSQMPSQIGSQKMGCPCLQLKKVVLKLITVFDPRYEIPSRNYFSRTGIPALYASTRDKVAQEIQAAKYFSATTDMWSSVGMKPYISFTAHFLDSNWKLQSRCLQTAFMPEDHTADNIVVALTDVLDAWQLNSSRLVAITTDSGSNIVSECKRLDWVRLSCLGHNLHLAIRKVTNDSWCTRAIAVCRKL